MSLEPVGQLPPQPWMSAAETRAVVGALTAEGAEVRFVGGCVRDAVLKRAIKDVDIATHDPPEKVMLLLERAGLRAIPTGVEHGTVTAVCNGRHFEITTLRSDVETFGRRARVRFTDDWAADAARRDLTMNALFCDPEGRIYDPFDGLQDLGAGRVRFVGDPMQRIEEDVLRLLRWFRFYAHYGRPPPDVAALAACRAMAHRLPGLSGERVCGELIKLLLAPDPASVLLLMQGERVLEWVLPEAQDFGRLRALCWLETRALPEGRAGPDALRRLAALVHSDAIGIEAMAQRLKLSNAQTGRLVAMAAPRVELGPGLDRQGRRRALRRLGVELYRDLVLLAWAGRKATAAQFQIGESAAWIELLDAAEDWRPVELPVRGADVLALGVPSGPAVGRLLAAVEQWWEEHDYQPDRAATLAELRRLAAAT